MKKFLRVVLLTAVCLTMSIPASADISDHLTFWLTMDIDTANNGDLFDASGKGVAATMKNGPSAIYDGAIGNALHFNGISYVTLPNTACEDFTISFWMRTTETAPSDANWYKGRGLVDAEVGGVTDDMGISQIENTVMFGVGNPDTNIKGTAAVNDGEWHHVVCTREQATGTMALYIDGALQGTATANTAALRKSSDLLIGDGHGYDAYVGDMDEVRLYNAVLSGEDIQTLYRKEGGQDDPPVPEDKVKPIYKTSAFRKDSASYLKKGRIAKMSMAGVEVTPAEQDGVLYVPARFVAFCFDEYAIWDNDTRSVTIHANGRSVTMKENTNEMLLQDGRVIPAAGKMYLTDETHVWLPVEDVLKALGQKVAVDGDTIIASGAFAPIDDDLKALVAQRFE